jgi:hypothetical protein
MKQRIPRKLGRPPLDPQGASTKVCVRLTCATYDELYAMASEAGLDVSAVIRDAIERRLIVDRRSPSSQR